MRKYQVTTEWLNGDKELARTKRWDLPSPRVAAAREALSLGVNLMVNSGKNAHERADTTFICIMHLVDWDVPGLIERHRGKEGLLMGILTRKYREVN